MDMNSSRSKSLHNFALPRLKWGNQRFLRCAKETGNSSRDSSVTDRRSLSSEMESVQFGRCRASNIVTASHRGSFVSAEKSSPLNPMKMGEGASQTVKINLKKTNGIDEVREKLMFDLKIAANKMKISMLEENEFHEFIPKEVKPWNLRTRQTSFKPPPQTDGAENLTTKTSKFKKRSRQQGVEKNREEPRIKFSISLSPEEVKNDFLAITGYRPARRPKKRSKIVQKQLNAVLPGFWLSEITPDNYKVTDIPVSK